LEFAEWALQEMNIPLGGMIIDPWNGSGTTAAACARLGYSFQGYDINPVMVHLGRARVASAADFREAEEILDTVREIAGTSDITNFRQIGAAFREIPVSNEAANSIAIAALFPYARKVLSAHKTRNPSWYRKGAQLHHLKVDRTEVFDAWSSLLSQVELWRSTQTDPDGVSIVIERGDSRKSLGRKVVFDAILTSPPYLTRLDYVQATLPEFLILGEFDSVPNIERLRRSMLGSPLTTGRPENSLLRLPPSVRKLLKIIREHPSKASASYYDRFFSTYFVDLHASMRNISNVLKPQAIGCMVVQSSHYKEIEVDLADAVIAMGEQLGLRHTKTVEFDSRRSMSLVNKRAHEAARKPKSEFAIFLRKE
jgi:hypothetical protein